MMLTGTLVNAAGILLGGGAGLLVHRLMRRGCRSASATW